MRIPTILLTLVTAGALAAGANAAGSAKDPTKLILQKTDFPAGVEYEGDEGDQTPYGDKVKAAGVDFDAAYYLGATYSKTKGFLQVTGTVFVTAGAGPATKAFAILKKGEDALWKDFGPQRKPVTLPSFGDQQRAMYDAPGAEGIALVTLLVRRGAVLWELNLKLERRPAPPMAEVLADLKTYATKQKIRVGRG